MQTTGDPYEVLADELPPAERRWVLPVAIAASVVILAVAVGLAWAFMRGGESDSAASPAPVAPTTEPVAPTPDPTPPTTEAPPPVVETTVPASQSPAPAEATVVVTVTASVAPEPTAPSTPAAPPPVGGLSEADAVAGLQAYFDTVAGNPDAGWGLLSSRRQLVEGYEDYREFWGSVSSAKVSNCDFDPTRKTATCDLTTVSGGKSSTSRGLFWLTTEGGEVRLEVAGGDDPAQIAAEQQLELLRGDSLQRTAIDGHWVAVLSAKRPGITDKTQVAQNGSNTFYFTDILVFHQQLESRFPSDSILMLRRSDWGKQTGGSDLWFTIADPGFGSKQAAEQWCSASFPGLTGKALENVCTPRELRPRYS